MTDPVDILLIEDNPNDVELAIEALTQARVANHIKVIGDGEEALEYIFGTGRHADRNDVARPRFILLDLKLPRVDGLQILKAIKGDPRTKAIPVVMMTSSHEERDMVASYEMGVNSYIVKPVDFDQFLEASRILGMYWIMINRPIN